MGMVAFVSLIERVESLRALCVENTGSQEIREISVDVPNPPLDELHFRKVVAWCYVLFQETGPFIGFSGQLLRARGSKAFERFGQTRRLVDCARTVQAHNLSSDSKSDMGKERYFQIWLQENGGSPTNWELCNQALMNDAIQVVSVIELEWKRMSEDDADRRQLWQDYQLEKDTSWDAHEFDRFVEQAAEEVGLTGLDSSLFRKEGDRLKRWRRLVSCFQSRAEAEGAIGRAIRAEMSNLFGMG